MYRKLTINAVKARKRNHTIKFASEAQPYLKLSKLYDQLIRAAFVYVKAFLV